MSKIERLKFFLLCPDVAKSLPVGCLSLAFLNWDSQQGRDLATSGRNKKNSIRPILFIYYEESLVSSNLNSKLLRFHCAHPNLHISLLKTTPMHLNMKANCKVKKDTAKQQKINIDEKINRRINYELFSAFVTEKNVTKTKLFLALIWEMKL